MCGRYSLDATPKEIVEAFALAESIAFSSRFNIAPTQQVPVVRADRETGGRRLEMVRWGLTPAWWSQPRPIINARSETIERRFRRTFHERRCLVPATGFYEWDVARRTRASAEKKLGGARQPFHIRRRDRGLFAFAGIWDLFRAGEGGSIEGCAILTTRPNRLIEPLHDRMPVILGPDQYAAWLDPTRSEAELKEMFAPPPEDLLEAYPVSRRVNGPANDDRACAEPLAAGAGSLFDTPGLGRRIVGPLLDP